MDNRIKADSNQETAPWTIGAHRVNGVTFADDEAERNFLSYLDSKELRSRLEITVVDKDGRFEGRIKL